MLLLNRNSCILRAGLLLYLWLMDLAYVWSAH